MSAEQEDFIRSHRFSLYVGFEGPPMGVGSIEFRPGQPWMGPGKVLISCALREEFIALLRRSDKDTLRVGMYTIKDELDAPTAMVVLYDVDFPNGIVSIDSLDANTSTIICCTAALDYGRLDIIFGPTLLHTLASASVP